MKREIEITFIIGNGNAHRKGHELIRKKVILFK
jgi:hypothetical protein